MVPSLPPSTQARFNLAHGGHASGVTPLSSDNCYTRSWSPGDPCHWQERPLFSYLRALALRLTALLQLCASFAYLQYRYRFTIGVFARRRERVWYALQLVFFFYELIAAIFPLCHALEVWNVVKRNCVDFKRIPNSLLPKDTFDHSKRQRADEKVPERYSNYPSIAVVIPCYKEETDMVLQVTKSALDMDYPRELLDVYLCDDGRDPMKQAGVDRLRRAGSYLPAGDDDDINDYLYNTVTLPPPTTTDNTTAAENSTTTPARRPGYTNVHYVARPDNKNAKPGNVNYTLERTFSDLIVQLDADFIARPHLIQRLLPYYFVWNSEESRYDFNTTLAFVQTPQHYRNMSAHDADFFDQRNIIFFSHILPGKDWFNCASMVGTSNLLNRVALTEAGNFPFHSKGDDTALSVIFHGLGYRSYYVNESVATGLAPPSLKGNLSQRNRWYKSDFEILFSKHGPLTQRGLSLIQRIMYLAVPMFRLLNIAMYTFDFLLVLVLVSGFMILDVTDPPTFIAYFVVHISMPLVYRTVECAGTPGVYKSVAANEVFEAVFRYSTLKGMVQALFKANKTWKLAEKTGAENSTAASATATATKANKKTNKVERRKTDVDGDVNGKSKSNSVSDKQDKNNTSTSDDSDESDDDPQHHNQQQQQAEQNSFTASQPSPPTPPPSPPSACLFDPLSAIPYPPSSPSQEPTPSPPQHPTTSPASVTLAENNKTEAQGDDDGHGPVVDLRRASRVSSVEICIAPSLPTGGRGRSARTTTPTSAAWRIEEQPKSNISVSINTTPSPSVRRSEEVAQVGQRPPPAPTPSSSHLGLMEGNKQIADNNNDTDTDVDRQRAHTSSASMSTNDDSGGMNENNNSNNNDSSVLVKLPDSSASPSISDPASIPSPTTTPAASALSSYRRFVLRNLKRCWYNVVMLIIFVTALLFCAINPPDVGMRILNTYKEDNVFGHYEYDNTLPLALTFVYTLSNLIPHALAILLCFRRKYLTGWILPDLINGRCDEWTVRPASGGANAGRRKGEKRRKEEKAKGEKGTDMELDVEGQECDHDGENDLEVHENGRELYVPRSPVTGISLVRSMLVFAGVVYTVVFSLKDTKTFVPVS